MLGIYLVFGYLSLVLSPTVHRVRQDSMDCSAKFAKRFSVGRAARRIFSAQFFRTQSSLAESGSNRAEKKRAARSDRVRAFSGKAKSARAKDCEGVAR